MHPLIEKLKAGKRYIRKMKFPGTDIEIGIQALNEDNLQQALFDTERHFKSAGIEVSTTTIGAYEKELITQTLLLALVDPSKPQQNGTYPQLFTSADNLRSTFVSQAVKDELVEAYNDLQNEVNPKLSAMSDAEIVALWDTVKKNPDSLTSLSSDTLRQLLRFTASRQSS